MKTMKVPMFINASLFVSILVILLGMVGCSSIEVNDLKAELDGLKKEQALMQKQLVELKATRAGRGRQARSQSETFQPLVFSTEGAAYLGDRDAPITLIEFTDYQCPYCRRHVVGTLPSIIKDYVESGQLRYVVRELPVESRHPLAAKAAEAALCAGDQDKYWAMHDKLFANQARLHPDELKSYASSLGLNVTQFNQCLDNGDKRKRVQEDVKTGFRAKVRGTPTFFLGLTGEGLQFKATRVIRGAKTYPEFAIVFDELLAKVDKEIAVEAVAAGSDGRQYE